MRGRTEAQVDDRRTAAAQEGGASVTATAYDPATITRANGRLTGIASMTRAGVDPAGELEPTAATRGIQMVTERPTLLAVTASFHRRSRRGGCRV